MRFPQKTMLIYVSRDQWKRDQGTQRCVGTQRYQVGEEKGGGVEEEEEVRVETTRQPGRSLLLEWGRKEKEERWGGALYKKLEG